MVQFLQLEYLPNMSKRKTIRPPAVMTDKKQVSASSDPKPDVMKLAKEARSQSNSLSDDKREESFNHGMRLIYGGSKRVAAKAGRP